MANMAELEATNLAAHVAACIERHKTLNVRLRRLEYALYGLIVVLIANGSGPVTQALLKAVGHG